VQTNSGADPASFPLGIIIIIIIIIIIVIVVVEALYYKPECRDFESDEVIDFFNFPNPSSRDRPCRLLNL
jgi:hypothetical protein